MREIFADQDTKGVLLARLLVDASNALNSLNHRAALLGYAPHWQPSSPTHTVLPLTSSLMVHMIFTVTGGDYTR